MSTMEELARIENKMRGHDHVKWCLSAPVNMPAGVGSSSKSSGEEPPLLAQNEVAPTPVIGSNPGHGV